MKKLCFVLLFLLVFISCRQEIDNQEEVVKEVNFTQTEITLKQYEEIALEPICLNCEVDELIITLSNSKVSVEELVVKGLEIGETTIFVKIKDTTFETSLLVTIIENETLSKEVTISGENMVLVGESTKLTATVLPSTAANKSVTWKSENQEIATINQAGIVTGVSKGNCVITATTKDLLAITATYTITVYELDTTKPIIYIDEVITTQNASVSYNKDFDPLYGVIAMDDVDGDITHLIEYTGSIDTRKLGTYTFTYKVSDSSQNRSEVFMREIKVIWDYSVIFVGHAGSYSGIMNTETAFLNAINVHGYTALECDLKQTKDGVFVMCHDDTFGGLQLNATNYSDLKDVEITQTRGGVTYTSKICTLKRYLQICKQYNITPVIELKYSLGINNNDTSRMQALMDEIEEMEMLDKVVLLGSQYVCLQWTRQNGYNSVACQYLVNSIESETVYNRCVEWDLDVSFNIEHPNSIEWIQRYQDSDLLVACYTFSQYSTPQVLQSWINKGVNFVTVDVIKPYEVDLPTKNDEAIEKFKVTFLDEDGTILKEMQVRKNQNAIAPVIVSKEGYEFDCWSGEFTNITSELTVQAVYKLKTYKITYIPNTNQITYVAWTSKDSFVTEFYNDFFTWLTQTDLACLTKANNTYTINLNGVTVSFTDGISIKALDVYQFEKTLANLIYLPINRVDDNAVLHEINNSYFLNTEPYRTKYQKFDQYFLNCILTSYTSYDKGYNPTSNGRVQIFFRFHQWCNGTKIASFDKIPEKLISSGNITAEITLPSITSYTIMDSLALEEALSSDDTLIFVGWNTESDGSGKYIKTIEKGTTGDLVVYAQWSNK